MSDDEDLEEREQMEALRREEEAFEEEMRKLELEQKRQMELDARQNAETMDALRDLEARSDLFAESNDTLVGKIVAKKSEQENIKNKTKNFSIDLDADEDVERILKEAREGSERKAKTMANEESERLRKLQEEKARQERLAWAKKEADLARKRIDEVLKATERVEAEKKFIPRLQKELGSPQGFQRFRKASKAYKNNKISAKQYLEMFADEIGVAVKGSQLLQEMLPGLAALVPTEDHRQRLLKEYTLYLERLLSDEKYEKKQREIEERRVLQRQEALREKQREIAEEEARRKAEESAREERLRSAAKKKKEREERLRKDQAKSEKLKQEREKKKQQQKLRNEQKKKEKEEEENRARIERIKAQKKKEEEKIRMEKLKAQKKKEEQKEKEDAHNEKSLKDEEVEEEVVSSKDGVVYSGGRFCISIPHWLEDTGKELYEIQCSWFGGKTYKSTSWNTRVSYSQLRKIHMQLLERVEILKLRVGENIELPKFPSDTIAMATGKHIKRFKGSGRIEQRRNELEFYLQGILKIKGILGWKPIENFLELSVEVRKHKQKTLLEARKRRENEKLKKTSSVPVIPKSTNNTTQRVIIRTASQEKSFEEDPLAFLVGN